MTQNSPKNTGPELDVLAGQDDAGGPQIAKLKERFKGSAAAKALQIVEKDRVAFAQNADALKESYNRQSDLFVQVTAERDVLQGENQALMQTNEALAEENAALRQRIEASEEAAAKFTAKIDESEELRALRAELAAARQQAHQDHLTGLPNRRAFEERLNLMASEQHHHGGHVAVLYIDLNDFGVLNKKFGHDVGDECLKTFAEALKANVRKDEIAARIGGDEFCVLLHDFKQGNHAFDEAIKRFESALSSVVYQYGQGCMAVTASVGLVVATSEDLYADPEKFIRQADARMSEIKSERRAAKGSAMGVANELSLTPEP